MKLTPEDYTFLAGEVLAGTKITMSQFYSESYVFDECEPVAKERARQGKGGRMYTPGKTRGFEKKVADWGKASGMEVLRFPLEVWINIYDTMGAINSSVSRRQIAMAGLDYYQKNDIDNITKAIQDGLNGVLYKDDKQIVKLHVSRRYSTGIGFRLAVARAGLSKSEVQQLEKYLWQKT